MLREIQSDALYEKKPIPFNNGLNIIQGYSGNSIGKTSFLKIIDVAFGGSYYMESNDDVISHIGHHEINFMHTFNNENFYFKRVTSNPNTVYVCDEKYQILSQISREEFNKKMLKLYGLGELDLPFRTMVNLYSRIWNKPNHEVKRPLYNHNAQTLRNAVIDLVKLFNEYNGIKEITEQNQYLEKRRHAINNAKMYHIVTFPKNKSECSNLQRKIQDISHQLEILQRQLSIVSPDNATQLVENESNLFITRSELISQLSRNDREVKRVTRNIQQMSGVNSKAFLALKEFFPTVNTRKIETIEKFHKKISELLLTDLEMELTSLQQRHDDISLEIEENEAAIQKLTGLSATAKEIFEKMYRLSHEKDDLQEELELYDDRLKTVAQVRENKKKVEGDWKEVTDKIATEINGKIEEYSTLLHTSNKKPPCLTLKPTEYQYGVADNTGTGKAYTDLILFDLAVLALTPLPFLIHDSFLLNNIDAETIQDFIKIYNSFPAKQIFIALDRFMGSDNEEVDKISLDTTRLFLSDDILLYGQDWRK